MKRENKNNQATSTQDETRDPKLYNHLLFYRDVMQSAVGSAC